MSKRKGDGVGHRGEAIIGLEQTAGDLPPSADHEEQKWRESLPLADVARRWGLRVRTFDARIASVFGIYSPGRAIAVGV
jgi:hypothetical protein